MGLLIRGPEFVRKIAATALSFACLVSAVASEGDGNDAERLVASIYPGRMSAFRVSPDGKRVAYLAAEKGKTFSRDEEDGGIGRLVAVIDKSRSAPFDSVEEPIFSPDSKRTAFLASKDNRKFFVVDGKIGRTFPDIAGGYFSSDSKKFTVQTYDRDSSQGVEITDGEEQRRFRKEKRIYSPDGSQFADVVDSSNGQQNSYVVINGKNGKPYEWISNFTFSPDGKRNVYFAGSEVSNPAARRHFVVLDGKEGYRYNGLEIGMAFSADSKRLLYQAQIRTSTGYEWTVVVDGVEGRRYARIRNPIFSPDGKRVAYIASNSFPKGDLFVVVDGVEGRRYSGKNVWLDYVIFSPDSQRIAFPVRTESGWIVVVDGVESPPFDHVGKIVFSADSKKIAFVASKRTGPSNYSSFVVVNGVQQKAFPGSISELIFSPDSNHLVYVVETSRRKDGGRFVVVDERQGKDFDLVLSTNHYDPDLRSFTTEPGSVRFDPPSTVRYLAIRNKRVYMVSAPLH